MFAPVLATKLFIPSPRPNLISRPRLIERLNEGLSLGCKLTLISASAGFGKTTLVSEWVAGCERPVAWLSLDEGDNDLTRFLTYMIAALQTLPPKNGEANIGAGALAVLQTPQPPPTEIVLTTLLNEISTLSDRFILVLDDYHALDSRPVDAALTFLVAHLPPQMHLVITTREDPHLPLARLRARGQLNELRLADLRFTPAEAAEFLNRVMGLNLSIEESIALETRTEGWIAGLQLASLALQGNLSMQAHPDAASFIQAFAGSHHFVLDYLLEEVLQQQSESVQTFLLGTSILSRMCGPLCDAVLLDTAGSGQNTLEYLERVNLFMVPLDNERYWFRFHHLFGDILKQRLGQSRSPAEIAAYHSRASLWFEKHGDVAEAFQHALAAGDFERAAGLAESAWQGMNGTFQSAAWLGWVKKLPDDATRVRPVLCTQMAQALMDAGEPEISEACLQAAERCLHGLSRGMVVADETLLSPLPAVIAMTRAYNAQVQGDLAATVKYSKLALQLIPEDDDFRRAQATITLEVTHWARGDLGLARAGMSDWMNSTQKAGNFVFFVASAFALADILIAQGHLREAVTTYLQSLQLASKHGQDAQRITAHHYLGLTMLHHEMGEDEAAAEELQKAQEMGEQTTLVDWSYRWHLAQARLKESGGDLEGALIQLVEASRVYVKNPIPDTRPIEALKAKVYLQQGQLAKAQAWVRARELSAEDELTYLGEFEHLILARVLIAEYQSRQDERSILQATGLLERLLKAAEAQERAGSIIEILVALALAHQMQGNLPLALASLERALKLAEPEGYLRIFVDEGEPLRLLILDFRSLIEKQKRNQDNRLIIYTDKLLAAFSKPVVGSQTTTGHQKSKIGNRQSTMVEPLSERELEVLKLLRTELSGPEIAGQLVISPNTFRTHTKNIFAKLGVNNRRAAVRRAEELDLI